MFPRRRGFEFLLPLEMARLFGWGAATQGYVQSTISALGFLSSNLLMNGVSGGSYELVAKFASVGALGTAIAALSGLAPSALARQELFVGGCVVYATEVPASPAIRGAIVDAREPGGPGLGEILGAAALVEGLTALVAAAAYGEIIDALPATAPYAPASLCLLLAAPVALLAKRAKAAGAKDDYRPLAAGEPALNA